MHIVHAAVDKPNKHAAITLVLVCKCMYTLYMYMYVQRITQ